jgi:ABC-type multidrug transport system ATPase subunit
MTSGPEHSLSIVNHPYYTSDKGDIEVKLSEYTDGETLAFILSILYIYWLALFVTPYIKEWMSGSKSLQLICGVNKLTYWLSALLMDLSAFLLAILFIILTIMCFNTRAFFSGFWLLLYISFIFSLSAFPLMYLLVRRSKESFNAKMNLVIVALFAGMMPYLMIMHLFQTASIFAEIFYTSLMVSPFFVLFDIFYFFRFYTIKDMLEVFCQVYELEQCNADLLCQASPKFCATLVVNDIVAGRLFFIFISGLFYFCLLMAFECKIFKYKKNVLAIQAASENLDPDVAEENQRVDSLAAGQIAEHCIVLKNVSSRPGLLPEIRNFSMIVEEGSCLVVLGEKNSGSMILKMLVGEEELYSGEAYVKNSNVRSNQSDVCRKIGYCSNQFAFIKYLSGQENLEVYGLSKGIPIHSLNKEIKKVTDDLRISEPLDKPVRTYNLTNRKKMCLAIAMIGDPQILLLDNPLLDLDSTSRRQFLAILNKLKANGKTIILTTNKLLDEAEAICNKLAILKEGSLVFLGAPQYLKKKLSKGVNINCKLKKQEDVLNAVVIDGIKDYMQRSFQNISRW